MPTASQTLIQQRARIIEQMREAVKKGDELRALCQSAAEYDVVFDKAEAAEKHLEKLEERGTKPGASAQTEYREAFLTWFRHGAGRLSSEERQILQSNKVEERAQSTSTTAGGYLIAPEFMPELERSLKDYSGVMQVARMISTETGANLPWPTIDATARKATLVAENATSTPTDFTFGQKSLDAYMYRDMAAVSLELMQDSAFDIGQFISESFAESFGRGLNEHFTTGTGSGQPNGLVTASTLGETAASATAFMRTEMVTHLHKVDPAYRRSRTCGWMMNDAVLAAIKKLAVGTADASPLWQPSMRDGAPDLIEGFPFWINQDMDSALTTGKKIMLFGDYSKYIVRRVLGMALRRLEERFIDSGQIGFIAFARYDADLINTAAVKHFKLA